MYIKKMNDFNPLFYPFYEHLTPLQKSIYNILYDNIKLAKAEIPIDLNCTSDDVFKAIAALHHDKPAFYWMTGGSSLTTINNVVKTIKPKYNALASDIPKHNAEIKKVMNDYFSNISDKNPLQQELYIHDRLAHDVSYAHSQYDQTAYAALVQKQAVCAGYSRAFQLLMQILKIPCYYISGTAKSKKNPSWGEHAWNMVKLGADYYIVDLTWNDCYGERTDHVSYEYFNCTEDSIAHNHKRDSDNLFLPKAAGTKYSYMGITGINPNAQRVYQDGVTNRIVVHDRNSFISVVTSEMKKTKKTPLTFSFAVKGKAVIDNAKDWFPDAVKNVYGSSVGWKYSSKYTDYNNGWYRLEYRFSLT